jgi:methylenetetrahydrofolate reductase (NADPH)
MPIANFSQLARFSDACGAEIPRWIRLKLQSFGDDTASIRSFGLDLPIVPGIMPIANFSQLARFSDACGAEIPRWIRLKLQSFGDDTASIRSFGLDVVTDLCDRLLAQGAPGLHFYTMNQAGLTTTVWQRLGL